MLEKEFKNWAKTKLLSLSFSSVYNKQSTLSPKGDFQISSGLCIGGTLTGKGAIIVHCSLSVNIEQGQV